MTRTPSAWLLYGSLVVSLLVLVVPIPGGLGPARPLADQADQTHAAHALDGFGMVGLGSPCLARCADGFSHPASRSIFGKV